MLTLALSWRGFYLFVVQGSRRPRKADKVKVPRFTIFINTAFGGLGRKIPYIMKKLFLLIFLSFLVIGFSSCSSSKKYSVVAKAGDIDLQIDLKTNSRKFPSSPYTTSTPHLMSYSITNLDKEKKFNVIGDGGTERPYLLFTFLLSNKTMIEKRADFTLIQSISPLMTTTDQSIVVDLPKKEKIKNLVSVNVHYDNLLNQLGSTIPELKKHVSIDTGCSVNEIEVKDVSEQLGNAIYLLNVCGKEMKYRRTGTVFHKDGEDPAKIKK